MAGIAVTGLRVGRRELGAGGSLDFGPCARLIDGLITSMDKLPALRAVGLTIRRH